MSLSDQQSFSSALEKDKHIIHYDSQYLNVQKPFLPDLNNGDYSSGIVQFNTSGFSSMYVNYSESWLALPMQLTSSTGSVDPYSGVSIVTGATGGSGIAFKSSALQAVYGISVTSSSGQVLVNEPRSVFINSIRPLINSDFDYSNTAETLGFFGCDRATSTIAYGQVTSNGNAANTTAIPTNRVSGAAPLNPTLANRCLIMANQATQNPTATGNNTTNVGVIYYTAYLPLRLITDLFKRLDFPILNASFLINIYLSGVGAGSDVMPFTVQTCSPVLVAPTIRLGSQGGLTSATSYSGSSARLYLKTCQLNGEDTKLYRRMLESGEEKVIEYIVSDVFQNIGTVSTIVNGATSISSFQITNNSIRPIRVWVLSCRNGATTGASGSSGLFPGGTSNVVRWFNTNLLVNNSNYYQNNLENKYELFELVKEQLPQLSGDPSQAGSGIIGLADFLNNTAPLCFDISRYQQSNPNSPVSLAFSSSFTDPGFTCDLYFVVERIQSLRMKLTENGISLAVSQGTISA